MEREVSLLPVSSSLEIRGLLLSVSSHRDCQLTHCNTSYCRARHYYKRNFWQFHPQCLTWQRGRVFFTAKYLLTHYPSGTYLINSPASAKTKSKPDKRQGGGGGEKKKKKSNSSFQKIWWGQHNNEKLLCYHNRFLRHEATHPVHPACTYIYERICSGWMLYLGKCYPSVTKGGSLAGSSGVPCWNLARALQLPTLF